MTTPVIFSGLERRERLLQFIETHERVTITEICEEFLVSPATVRRDLEALELSGQLRRFHGGALAVKSAPPEPPSPITIQIMGTGNCDISRKFTAIA